MNITVGPISGVRRITLLLLLGTFLVTLVLAVSVASAQTDANWNRNSPPAGNWTTSSNWNCPSAGMNCVPNNAGGATYNVTIKPNNPNLENDVVDLNNLSSPSSIAVNSLAVGLGAFLTLSGGASLTVNGLLTNDGYVRLAVGTITANDLENLSGGTLSGNYSTYDIEGTFDYGGGSGNTISAIGTHVSVMMVGGAALMTPDGSTNALSTLNTNNGRLELDNGAGVGTKLTSLTGATGTLALGGSQLSVNGNYDQLWTLVGGTGSALEVGGTFTNGGAVAEVDAGGTITASGFGNLSGGTLSGEGPFYVGGVFRYGGGSGNTINTIASGASVLLDAENGGAALITPDGTTDAFENLSTINGVLDLENGAKVETSAPLTVGEGGTLHVGVNGSILTAPTVRIAPGGELCGELCAGFYPYSNGGAGTISDDVINDGTFSPGSSSTFTINGNYSQNADGALVIDVSSATDFSVLDVNGAVALGGTMDIDFLNNYVPGANTEFAFLEAETATGDFAHIQLSGVYCPSCTFDLNTLIFDTGGITPTLASEPSSLILFVTALLGLCVVGLRTKSQEARRPRVANL